MAEGNGSKSITDLQVRRYRIDLSNQKVAPEIAPCSDLEDMFGGIARGFKLLDGLGVDDAYDPAATLIMNLGVLSGTDFMTGLRTYFHAYSPLKRARNGRPSAMWSAGSGKFGTKLRYLGVEEVIFTGRCEKPSLLRIHKPKADGEPAFEFIDAAFLLGGMANHKIQTLHDLYPNAHFAVIGPAGENYLQVRYAAIALSTENQLKSGDHKSRFCGRGGMGGVMGSKNLIGIIADIDDVRGPRAPAVMKELNNTVARGDGSRRFRDRSKKTPEGKEGGGGTWANYEALNPVHAMPELNFNPTGTTISLPLHRGEVEKDNYVIKDEACYRCGIRCHKNVYDKNEDGKAGQFRAKLDFEPLNLLSSNLGIFDIDDAVDLVDMVDEFCMDSISCGVTLAYAMEYNRRHPEAPIADGLSYGDYEKTLETIIKIGNGELELLGQGSLRAAESVGETGYAMQCKGVEFPAYLPQTNPGYPWALAGGHMSMRTYLLLLNEKETAMDYWVDAITNPKRGLSILRDDFLGICKFSGMTNADMCTAIEALVGVSLQEADIEAMIRRVFLRGYGLERQVGFTNDDYNMPAEVHLEYSQVELPYFNTPEFFAEMQTKVNERFDAMLKEEGLAT